MLRHVVILVLATALSSPVLAASYKCANESTAVALNDHDIRIAKNEAGIAEMKAEIAASGGSTDDQSKVLASFEDKLAKIKSARAALMKDCAAEPAP